MPPQKKFLDPIDYMSHLHNFITSDDDDDDDVIHDRVPGAWLDGSDFEYESFSDSNTTRSRARVIADSALADLERAASEAETERLRRQGPHKRRATEGKKLSSAVAKGQRKPAASGLNDLGHEIAEEERLRSQGLSERPAAEEKKLGPAVARGNKKTASSDKSSDAVLAQSNVAGVPTNEARMLRFLSSLSSEA
jgi:hypothetical protein